MTWVKIDDQFQDHPKFVGAPLATIGLWTAGLAYCNRYLTDGHIQKPAVDRIGGKKAQVDDLLARGLWKPCVDGHKDCFVYHDYLDVQPSRDRVLETREVRADAGRKGGQARAKQLAKQNGKAELSNEPSKTQARGASPRPVPSRPIDVTTSSGNSRRPLGGSRGDDDDGDTSTWLATAACHLLAERRYSARPRPHVEDATGYLATCRRNAEAEYGDAAIAVASEHADWTAEQVADEVQRLNAIASHPAGGPHLAVVPPTPEELANRPLCECGMPAGHRSPHAEGWQ